MLKKIKMRIKKSIWFYPSLYIFISLLLALLVIMIDSGRWIALDQTISKLFLTRIDLAQVILGISAAALISITTFTFSTTMVVLTLYSSQFSPRTVENFLSDDNTMKALGVFMGGFVYSVIALLFSRDSVVSDLVIAGTVAIVYMLVCLFRFTMYIHHVGSHIQTNNLVGRLNQEAVLQIEEYRETLNKGTIVSNSKEYETPYKIEIKSNVTGYIQFVDYESLQALGDDVAGTIIFEKVIGQFVTDETKIFSIYFLENTEEDEELFDRLRSFITIDKERTEMQDFNFSIQKIVEIALRAISSGINDPNTAKHCLRITGVLLSKLADIEGSFLVLENDQKKGPKVVLEVIDFEKELYASFSQIIHYGKQDVSVMISLLKALHTIAVKASNTNCIVILGFLDYVWEKIDVHQMAGMDKQKLEHEKEQILLLKRSKGY